MRCVALIESYAFSIKLCKYTNNAFYHFQHTWIWIFDYYVNTINKFYSLPSIKCKCHQGFFSIFFFLIEMESSPVCHRLRNITSDRWVNSIAYLLKVNVIQSVNLIFCVDDHSIWLGLYSKNKSNHQMCFDIVANCVSKIKKQ